MTGNRTKSGNKKRKKVLVCSRCHYTRKSVNKNQKCPKCGKPHHQLNLHKKLLGIARNNYIRGR